MRLSCPICGDRPLEEFSYRGDATLKRPQTADVSAAAEWHDYVYLRDNPRGPHTEHWRHGGGCGAWLEVERDTLTHEVFAVRLAKTGKGASK